MTQNKPCLGHRTFEGIHDQKCAISHIEHALNFAAEIGVTRRVDDVDLHIFIGDRDILGQDGDATFALLVVRVEHALLDVLVFTKDACSVEQAVDERGLAVVDMSNDRNVTDVFLSHSYR